jgi:hypothetical protein
MAGRTPLDVSFAKKHFLKDRKYPAVVDDGGRGQQGLSLHEKWETEQAKTFNQAWNRSHRRL